MSACISPFPLQFTSIGETAIALWGNTEGSPIPGMGPDGTGGDQPRFTHITENFGVGVGVWTKQNAFVFSTKSCQNVIQNNM